MKKYMCRCIELASNATGYTAPNPMVGCVVVCDDRIIGEGFHQKYGAPHAEVNAIQAVRNPELLKRSTLYVSLEPCSHQGKTPPCADLIVSCGIPHIITGSSDPNPLVSGRGIARLRAAGCQVTEHVLEEACNKLNKRFMTFHRRNRPYIVLKWAQTDDGFIDIIRDRHTIGRPTWITGSAEQTLVHKWRSEEQSVMVGTNTALADNPMLNLRRWSGQAPLRIVLDRTLRLPESLHLFDNSQPTIVLTEQPKQNTAHIQYAGISFDGQLPQHITDELYRRNIISILIEGGSQLLQSFIDAGLWDEARIFVGKKSFGNGIQAPVIPWKPAEVSDFENSKLYIMYANQ